MGRPPCCEKVGIKKGPWTPEEDVILVSYIQENGPGNWRTVPTNTGLLRCSKSCRLRWTNYLRPGIKRGNFTPHEEGMIVHLQALLGNKWAAIASYLPQRTDNDIKNYWNTHLKKKLKKFQMAASDNHHNLPPSHGQHQKFDGSYSDFKNLDNTKNHQYSSLKMSENSSVYASSAENISRLLEGWMRTSPTKTADHDLDHDHDHDHDHYIPNDASVIAAPDNPHHYYKPKMKIHVNQEEEDELQCILSFNDNLPGVACNKSLSGDSSRKGSERSGLIDQERTDFGQEKKPKMENSAIPPLSFLEKWLLDESANQVMELPSIF